jgi:glutamate/tyrosine decarboxylase-like PLP-dependent enzyme
MKAKRDFEDIFPERGWPAEQVLTHLQEMKQADASVGSGRMFGFVYYPGEEAGALLEEVCRSGLYENALCPSLFPSILHCEREVIATVANLLHGGSEVRGNVTSGGTESIFLALKSARDFMRRIRPLKGPPEIILPVSAHPAFRKASHILGLNVINLPLDRNYCADLTALPAAINDRTIMLVASAPCYPYGVIDPIGEMSSFAQAHGLLFHVDACIGGMFLPFMEKLGYPVPVFDFRLKGVTSISTDLHKYGYGLKGASVILYRDREMHREQFFVHNDWPGGLFGTPTFLGSRSSVPIAAAWAMLKFHGMEGYVAMTRETMETVEALKKGISGIEGLKLVGEPVMSVFSFSSESGDIYELGDALQALGWYPDRIMEPPALHLMVTQANIPEACHFLEDLNRVVQGRSKKGGGKMISAAMGKMAMGLVKILPAKSFPAIGAMASRSVKKARDGHPRKSATFYGIAACIEDKSRLDEIVLDYLEGIYS